MKQTGLTLKMCEEDDFVRDVIDKVRQSTNNQQVDPTEYEELDAPSFLGISREIKHLEGVTKEGYWQKRVWEESLQRKSERPREVAEEWERYDLFCLTLIVIVN